LAILRIGGIGTPFQSPAQNTPPAVASNFRKLPDMKTIRLVLILSLFSLVTFSQSQSVSFVIFYEKVIEYQFDEQTQNFKKINETISSGAISVDNEKIFIKGYNNKPNNTLKIISKDFDYETQRNIYKCTQDEIEYLVLLTQDYSFLSLIGLQEKYVYELKRDDNRKKEETYVVLLNNEKTDDEPIYIYGTVEKNPLFEPATNDNETKDLINKYIIEKIKELQWNKKGKAYVQFIIDKKGRITKTKIIYGKDNDFNDFALKVVDSFPNWIPGEKNGEKVLISHTIEVKVE
jgi:hypothetical protein